MNAVVRVAAALLVLPLLLSLGAAASADDGRPAQTVGRPPEPPPRRDAMSPELVLLVGGLNTHERDGSWTALLDRLRGDPRFEVRVFGTDPRHPYDSDGPVAQNAASLVAAIRENGGRRPVHIVAHSMGGVVVDRAIAAGLSRDDGLRTYVALASPHSGSTAARVLRGTLALSGDEAADLRPLVRPFVGDGQSAAVRDLAEPRSPPRADGVSRLSLRLATDVMVSSADAKVPGGDVRTLLPSSIRGIDGHGAVLSDPVVLEAVLRSIRDGSVPPDARAATLRHATDAVAGNVDAAALAALLALALAALAAAYALRSARRSRRALDRSRQWLPATR